MMTWKMDCADTYVRVNSNSSFFLSRVFQGELAISLFCRVFVKRRNGHVESVLQVREKWVEERCFDCQVDKRNVIDETECNEDYGNDVFVAEVSDQRGDYEINGTDAEHNRDQNRNFELPVGIRLRESEYNQAQNCYKIAEVLQ